MENKIAIGIRTTPSIVYYSIIEETGTSYIHHVIDRINIPAALQKPEQLKFIRNTLLDIITEFSVCYACIRVTESAAQSPNPIRIGIEAVIQELFASSTVKKYYAGQISNISSKLEISREEFKPFVEGTEAYNDIEGWSNYSPEHRESLLAGYSALNL